MADGFDIEISLIAKELSKDLENAAPQIAAEIHKAVENLAHAAFTAMVAKIQGMSMDPKNRQDYLRALKFETLGDDTYVIYLDGENAKHLEEGYGAYSIKEKLLASEKVVGVGSRAGEKWVRTAKDGHKYAAVPFEHQPFSSEKSKGDLAADIKRLTAKNRSGSEQPITQIFADLSGKPIHGKVATVGEVPGQPNLSGLTKYQHVHESGHVSSVYMTYRIVSENSPGWQHPGHGGYQIFKEAKEYVEAEMKNILGTLL